MQKNGKPILIQFSEHYFVSNCRRGLEYTDCTPC